MTGVAQAPVVAGKRAQVSRRRRHCKRLIRVSRAALKVDLGSELDFARTAADGVVNAAEDRTGDVGGGRTEGDRVGQVGGVAAEFQLHALVDRDALEEGRVQLEVVRADEEAR